MTLGLTPLRSCWLALALIGAWLGRHLDAPDGSAIVADGVWFARLEGGRARLYHAVVYARQPRQALADAFFAGLALQP